MVVGAGSTVGGGDTGEGPGAGDGFGGGACTGGEALGGGATGGYAPTGSAEPLGGVPGAGGAIWAVAFDANAAPTQVATTHAHCFIDHPKRFRAVSSIARIALDCNPKHELDLEMERDYG